LRRAPARGRVLPPAALAARRDALFAQLEASYADLTEVQDEHNATPYNCQRHGACCQVGLQLHVMECENVARHLLASYAGDPDGLEQVVERLEHALTDDAWTWGESVGDHMCAFYEDGCTIYPFRPGICRAYGVVVEVDEWCPRKRLPTGEPFVFAQKETDRMMARFHQTLDRYGRLHPERDYTVYMPVGVLGFLVPPERLRALKARTDKKFWRRHRGYRTQHEPSYRHPKALRTNVRFPFPIPSSPR
jgi:Fe-S-cluster containining protein